MIGLIQSLKQRLALGKTAQSDVNVLSATTTTTHPNTTDQHKLIKYALMIIGYDDITTVDQYRKELIALAKKLINYQIELLDEQGLKWLNDHFMELAALSTDSKVMFKQVYHKIVQDLQHISPTKKQLIINFINEGFTTSLTREGELILDGKKYKIQDQSMQLLLEEIAKAVINQDSDILANQYRDYKPIFPQSGGIGLKKAACDIEQVTSLLSKNYTLNNREWMLTSLIPERSEGTNLEKAEAEILLLEQRNSMGDHSVHVLNSKFKPQLDSSDTKHNKQMLEGIFGVYKEKTVYNAKTKMLSDEEGRRVAELNNQVKLTFEEIKGEEEGTQKYFQQELFNLGHKDRLEYIDQELKRKVTDNNAALQDALEAYSPKLKREEIDKLREYYSAFILTFSSLYTASQAVDSGQLYVDTSNLTTTILSTLASFAPFGIGDKLAGGIEKINDFFTGSKMANEAKLVKKLAADAVELSTLVGDVGRRIVLNPTHQKKITSTTVEDPSGIIGKFRAFIAEHKKKLANYDLAEKELHKSPAAALGEHDANTLIGEWVSQTREHAKQSSGTKAQDKKVVVNPTKPTLYLGMGNEDLKAEFTKLIIGEASPESPGKSPDKSPSKKPLKVSPEKTTTPTTSNVTTKGDDKPKNKKKNKDDDEGDDSNNNNNNKSSCCEIF